MSNSRKVFAAIVDGALDACPEAMQHRVIALGAARIITLSMVPDHTVKPGESFDLIEIARFITGETEPGVNIPKAVQ